MINFTKTFASAFLRFPLRTPLFSAFSTQNLAPKFAQLKLLFQEKGQKSQEYHQQMSKVMKEALEKYDVQEAINIELFHLGLIKQSEGEGSENYRSELREIARFCINRNDLNQAEKLILELRNLQEKTEGVSPVDVLATLFLQGYVYTNLGKFEQSKKCLQTCLNMKHAQEAPQVYFKVRSQLARNHIFLQQIDQALQQIQKCEQILGSRTFQANTPPMVHMMDLQDIYSLAEIVALLNNRQKVDEYIALYEERLTKLAGTKSPMHIQFFERKAKIEFNLQNFQASVDNLKEAIKLAEEYVDKHPQFKENIEIFKNIIDNISEKHLK